MFFVVVFFHEYIRLVYINLFVYLLQSLDRGSHQHIDQTKTTSRKKVYPIVIVQFKYVKMFSYYVVSMSILVSFGKKISMFLKKGVVRGTSLAVDDIGLASRQQVYIDAIVQI